MRYLLLFSLFLLLGCQDNGTPPATYTEETPAPPLEFEPYTFSDSVALRPGGPYFVYQLNTVRTSQGNEELRQLIDRTLAGDILNTSAPVDDLEATLPMHMDTLFGAYSEQDVDESLLSQATHTYSREEWYDTKVAAQTDSVIVLTNSVYTYTGGAHGMSYTIYYNFATTPPRLLTFDDIFRADSHTALSRKLTDRVAGDEELLGRVYSADSIPITENVGLLPTGIRFLYTPYDIGPYASGEIEIELPYTELDGLLQDGLPVPEE